MIWKTQHQNMSQYSPVYGNSLVSFTNTIDDLLLQLPILIKLKVQVLMLLFSIERVPVPLDAVVSPYYWFSNMDSGCCVCCCLVAVVMHVWGMLCEVPRDH